MKPVILSKEFDCQWFTHHKIRELLEDPIVIMYMESMEARSGTLEWAYNIEDYCDFKYGIRESWGDVTTLCIEYIEDNKDYTVELINGWETITYKE